MSSGSGLGSGSSDHAGAVGRRLLLRGGAAGLAAAGVGAVPGAALAARRPGGPSGETTARVLARGGAPAASGRPPVPPVVRSREALASAARAAAELPIAQDGVTYEIAQEVVWLDRAHFAVGRWDGSLSVFTFGTGQVVGPVIQVAASSPSDQGVQMITRLPGNSVVTSNDGASLALWKAPRGDWSRLRPVRTVAYPSSLGPATNGAFVGAGRQATLVAGHVSGDLSFWAFDPDTRSLRMTKTVAIQNPAPVNPWDSHVIYGLTPLAGSGSPADGVVAGSDDGYISIVEVPSGRILSQTVFNTAAQRGINSVSVAGTKLLVSNCSVGASDKNLWYFSIDPATWKLTLRGSANLLADTQLEQAFNFDAVWGHYSGGECWFASTEEGLLWMGTADTGIDVIGHQDLADGSFGAALAYSQGPGRLVAVIGNLYEFVTGA